MKTRLKETIKNIQKYLSVHKKTRIFLEYTISLLGSLISAAMFAFAFRAFLSPNVDYSLTIITGGASGLARIISTIAIMINKGADKYLIYSIANILINIPVIYVCIKFVSFRFGLFTFINVLVSSLLTKFADLSFIDELAKTVACVIEYQGEYYQAGLMARTILGGLFSGLSSSLAFAVGASAGGADAIGYYFSNRKSTTVGKYFIAINSVIIGLFGILSVFESMSLYDGEFHSAFIANAFVIILFGIVYQLVISLVIDQINRRNKKEQIQIITKEENLPKMLLANIPHGATIVRSKGAFTGEDRIIIYIIVSIHETRTVIDLVRSADPKSFINITSVKQVYGRFFIKPVK